MSFFDPQNPGLSGIDELTDSEVLVLQAITSLGDPNANVLLGWDDTDNTYKYIILGSGLSYNHSTHTLTASGGGGGSISDGDYGDIVVSGTGTIMTIDSAILTAYGRTLIVAADAASARTVLGVDLSLYGVKSGTLAQFASTTSAQLAGVLSDETGTGVFVLATSPTLVTPNLGAATATTLTITNAGTTSSMYSAVSSASGTSNFASYKLLNNLNDLAQIMNTSNGYTDQTFIAPRSLGIYTEGAGGIALMANQATATIRFAAGASTTAHLQIGTTGIATFSSVVTVGSGYQIGGAATSGKILKGNGTSFVASTETYANPGTSGNVMTSDGTNWTSSASTSGGNLVVVASPDSGILSGASTSVVQYDTSFYTVRFADGETDGWCVNFQVPTGATTISSIKVFYLSAAAATVRLKAYVSKVAAAGNAAYLQDATGTLRSYTDASGDSKIRSFTLNGDTFDAISSVVVNDIISVLLQRFGADASDSWNAAFDVHHIEVTFA